jgi:cysteine desulfurase family protein (TIGR01976 family)
LSVPEITPAIRDLIRHQFPALKGDVIFLENAGGSQVPRQVADGIHSYLTGSYVQLGATYSLSQYCTELVARAHQFISLLMNSRQGEVVLGSSTTALLQMLADCYRHRLSPGDEIILAESGHEANLGPWKKLADQGAVIKWWRVDVESQSCPLVELETLLTPKTVLVALPHTSNLLGDIVDLKTVCQMAHQVSAKVVADGVAFAPHRAMDCDGWDVDWYVYSLYKVYGPHMAALYGKRDAFAELQGPNHFFVPESDTVYKFEPGGVCHEGCAGILGLNEYMAEILSLETETLLDRQSIESAYQIMAACEQPVQQKLLDYLASNPLVRIIGPAATEKSRVGTISFVHEKLGSREIVSMVDQSSVAIRYGHMYAYHLCEALGLDPEDGVVRTSLVHYNTPAEIETLIEVFDNIPRFK